MTARTFILASESAVRRQVLTSAGVSFRAETSGVDEDAIKAAALQEGIDHTATAERLARAKASAVAARHPDAAVLGCDQVLVFEDGILDKPVSRDDLKSRLKAFRGRTHRLINASVLVDGATVLWRHVEHADLDVRDVSDYFLTRYLETEGDAAMSSVGGYRLEGMGVQLFDRIDGDYFTILGLSLLPLLEALRKHGILQP